MEDLQIDKENKSVEVSAKHFSLFAISFIEKKTGQTSSAGIEVGSTKRAQDLFKDAWYYLDSSDSENSGKMNTGWKYIGEQWYYFGTEEGEMHGKMSTGWKYISGKWYYLNPEAGANNGKMLFNTVVDGYTLGADGAWDNQAKKAN